MKVLHGPQDRVWKRGLQVGLRAREKNTLTDMTLADRSRQGSGLEG